MSDFSDVAPGQDENEAGNSVLAAAISEAMGALGGDAAMLSEVEAVFGQLAPLLNRTENNGQNHWGKKRTTVLAVVKARLMGSSIDKELESQPETCSPQTWHRSWKRDPAIMQAVERVYAIVTTWNDRRVLLTLRAAAERLALASLEAAKVAEAKLQSPDGAVALRAAFGILDRADFSTAAKGSQHLEMDEMLSAEEQAAVVAAMKGVGVKSKE